GARTSRAASHRRLGQEALHELGLEPGEQLAQRLGARRLAGERARERLGSEREQERVVLCGALEQPQRLGEDARRLAQPLAVDRRAGAPAPPRAPPPRGPRRGGAPRRPPPLPPPRAPRA